ncbi:unnamed protein product [Eruca vesicaria subsp. sativa]|uniref:Uncharacterized protein n=1 Tax=Eruca vesicaria subsp. sativa TaxID=29727 RepID=A0ABC8KTA1_ERUVS|nr:unnamed protein product [Eruca vesicaria subsp. sativa]
MEIQLKLLPEFEKDLSAIRGEGQYKGPIQIQSNALASLKAIDISVAEEVMEAGCITGESGDRINGLVDGVSGTWVISRMKLQQILACAVGEEIIRNESNVVDFEDSGDKRPSLSCLLRSHRLQPSLSNGYIISLFCRMKSGICCYFQTLMELRKAKPEAEQLFLFDQETTDKVRSEVPMFKLMKPSVLADRLREEGASRLTDTSAVVVKIEEAQLGLPLSVSSCLRVEPNHCSQAANRLLCL